MCRILFVILCLSTASDVMGIDVLLERHFENGLSAKLYRESMIEQLPVRSEEIEPGWHRLSGGNRYMDMFAMQLTSSNDAVPCSIVWMKSDTLAELEIVESQRLHVFDAAHHERVIWILYSFRGEVRCDLVEYIDGHWRTTKTISLFKQAHSEVVPRLVEDAKFTTSDGNLFVIFKMTKVNGQSEVWRLTRENAKEVENLRQ